jgi:hypothetical protein
MISLIPGIGLEAPMTIIFGYLRQAGTALRFLVIATLVPGLAYPLAVLAADDAGRQDPRWFHPARRP